MLHSTQADLASVAQNVHTGGGLLVSGVELDQFGPAELELERFTVFAPDVQIVVDDDDYSVEPPNTLYFRGVVAGMPNSIVVLAIPEQGPIRGMITDESGSWVLQENQKSVGGGLASRKVTQEEQTNLPSFECGADRLGRHTTGIDPLQFHQQNDFHVAELAANVTHTARLAIDTDYEYYAQFNNQNDALAYLGDLIAYSSTAYERETNTNLVIGWSRLFTTTNDPWSATDCCNGQNGSLENVAALWQSTATLQAVNRSLVHFISGKVLPGGSLCGCAYVGVLCNGTYGYGVSHGISGSFNINSPQVLWDSVVVAHEIGHNFNSPHTQDYCGVGGVSDPVDLCVNSGNLQNFCGTSRGLPGQNSLTGGTPGQGNGTIMSYCHLLSPGMSNTSFTFGTDHIYGVDADRVPAVMRSHVLQVAAQNPQCLALETTMPTPPSSPTGLSASDGTFTDKVRVNLEQRFRS
ncbi:MAG: hypothetical protein HC808_08265 [Candidatus Competibacteraceae bacterium]|nr:hypothetical protein [Candidatus Competibacteraceae bacterium]